MTSKPTLFDLFDAKSLANCERRLEQGEMPTLAELADILDANSAKPLPKWFIDLLVKGLRGELKRKAGRRKHSAFSQCLFAAAVQEYREQLENLSSQSQAERSRNGRNLGRGAANATPAHEQAARIAVERWRLHISPRSFLNRMSSEK